MSLTSRSSESLDRVRSRFGDFAFRVLDFDLSGIGLAIPELAVRMRLWVVRHLSFRAPSRTPVANGFPPLSPA